MSLLSPSILLPSLLLDENCKPSVMLTQVGELLLGTQQLPQQALYEKLQERFYLPYKDYFRFEIPESGEPLTGAQEQAFRSLGMLESIEPRAAQAYDVCVLPGGICTVTASLIRFILQQIIPCGITFPRLVFLGSERQLHPGELWQLKRYDIAGSLSKERPKSETDMLRALWRNAANLLGEDDGLKRDPFNNALSAISDAVQVEFIHCAAAPGSVPVGTAGSFVAWIEEAISSKVENPRVLLVAAQPYIRYQVCVLFNRCRERGYSLQCLDGVGPKAPDVLRGPVHLGNALATLLHEERVLLGCGNLP